MVLYFHLIKDFPQFVLIHIVKGSSVFTEAEVDFFLMESSCFFYDPVDEGNLISVSSAFFYIHLEHLEVLGSCTVED